MKQKVRVSISLDIEYRKKLSYLAELEHRRLSQQIVHMTEFYLKHQVETRDLLEHCIQQHYEHGTVIPDFIEIKTNAPVEVNARSQSLKTSQVLQENKGVIVSDVPEKKAKREFDSL